MSRLVRLALPFLLALPTGAAGADEAASPIAFTTHQIARFRIGDEATRFGALEWIGGFEIETDNADFGGVSGIVSPDGTRLYALTDAAFLAVTEIVRDASGRPVGLADGMIGSIEDADGPIADTRYADTESLDIDAAGRVALVSSEGRSRLLRADVSAGVIGVFSELPLPVRIYGDRTYETVAAGPPGTPLEGAAVVITEVPPGPAEANAGFIVGGDAPGTFAIVASDGFSITDGKFADTGELYLLERDYGLYSTRMRIRRVPAGAIGDGALIEPETLLEAGRGYQIDNMEGLALWRDADGQLRLAVTSDNNDTLMQRTLYLEFRLAE